jgi:nucleoside-diphosphate-sugar epimerase
VTGAAGPLGSALVDRLAHDPAAPKVIALDTVRGQTPGVSWRVADIRDPALASRLAEVGTLVHLATDRTATTPAEQRRAVNVRGTEILLDAAARRGGTPGRAADQRDGLWRPARQPGATRRGRAGDG